MNTKPYFLLPVVLWTAVVFASFFWNIRMIEAGTVLTLKSIGYSFFKEIQTTRLWNARHGGVYVPVTADTKPNPYLDDPHRDVSTLEGLSLTKINPAYMTRQIAEITKEEGHVQFHITSLKPIRPGNKPDAWEGEALLKFEAGMPDDSEFVGNGTAYRYMAPLPVKRACLKCHAKQGYKEGDIRGGISVTIPTESYLTSAGISKNNLMLIHLFALVAGLGIFFLFKGYQNRQMDLMNQKNSALERENATRKRYEKEVMESSLRLKSMYNALEEAVFIISPDRELLDMNPAAELTFGYTREELRNQSAELLHVDRDHYIEFGNRITEAFGRNETASFEFETKCKNGDIIPTEHSVSQMRNDEGKILGIVSVVRDISGRKEAEAVLREGERLHGVLEMAGAVCHELNQPLMAVSGWSELALMQVSNSSALYSKLNKIKDQVERMGEITGKLMRITRYETKDYIENKIIDIDRAAEPDEL